MHLYLTFNAAKWTKRSAMKQGIFSLKGLGRRISQELILVKPINVRVIFSPNVIKKGRGYANYLAANRDSGPLLLYPQAMLKQTQLLTEQGPDIRLYLDSSSITWTYLREGGRYDLERRLN